MNIDTIRLLDMLLTRNLFHSWKNIIFINRWLWFLYITLDKREGDWSIYIAHHKIRRITCFLPLSRNFFNPVGPWKTGETLEKLKCTRLLSLIGKPWWNENVCRVLKRDYIVSKYNPVKISKKLTLKPNNINVVLKTSNIILKIIRVNV